MGYFSTVKEFGKVENKIKIILKIQLSRYFNPNTAKLTDKNLDKTKPLDLK